MDISVKNVNDPADNLPDLKYSLRTPQPFLKAIFENIPEGIILVEADSLKIACSNIAFRKMFDYNEIDTLNLSLQDLHKTDNGLALLNQYNQNLNDNTYLAVDIGFKRMDNSIFYADVTTSTLVVKNKLYWLFVLKKTTHNYPDDHNNIINELKTEMYVISKSEEKFRQIALYDELTKLPNRRLLYDRLEQAMLASKRSHHYGALLFIDLDKFKLVNDHYGHSAGDHVLKEASIRIMSCLREIDTVARFGGDEFVVLLSELDTDRAASFKQVKTVADKICNVVSDTYPLSPKEKTHFNCTSSIGVVLFMGLDHSIDEVLKVSDKAMYKAKQAGGDQVCLFETLLN